MTPSSSKEKEMRKFSSITFPHFPHIRILKYCVNNRYLRCFYFAMKTATKIGKNPKPANNVDRTFMIFNWLIGVFACAAIIGQVWDQFTHGVVVSFISQNTNRWISIALAV